MITKFRRMISAVMIAQRGSEDAEPGGGIVERQLRLAGEHIAYKLPVDQILGMIDGYAGEILKRGIDNVIVVAHTTDTWVGMVARNDWIPVLCNGA